MDHSEGEGSSEWVGSGGSEGPPFLGGEEQGRMILGGR